MKSIAYLLSLLAFALLLSCDDQQSLQEYYVENSEKSDFISLDVPASVINLSEVQLNEKQREGYESVRKFNILAFKVNDNNKTAYEAEKVKVKEILNNPRYQELMKFNSGKQRGTIKFLGTDASIDELVIFGSDNSRGFALVRVLGDDMRPENMAALMEVINKANVQGEEFDALKGFFGNNNSR